MTPPPSAPRRRIPLVAAFALLALGLASCAPEAVGTPSPSPSSSAVFASEEEAFAAAEETYRAYNDAVNDRRSGDADSDPLTFLTGSILDAESNTLRDLESSGISIHGNTVVTSFEGITTTNDQDAAKIIAAVCLDISDARAIDLEGNDVTAKDRSNQYGLKVTMVGNPEQLLISEYEVDSSSQC